MAEYLTLARPYAKAVFHLAQENNRLQEWSEILETFSFIAHHKEVSALQGNPNVSSQELVELFCSVSGTKDPQAKSFLELLAENGRLSLLTDVHVLFEQHKAEALKQIDVELISATQVTEQQKAMFKKSLTAKLGKEVNLICREDPTLVGGAIVRAGDKVIDGSVRGKLYQMAESLGA